jgi:uncharacterized alpha-E superfamily protein
MLSRVADSIYWLARYMERAENISRLLLSTQDLLLDAGAEAADERQFWEPLLLTTGDDEVYAAAHPSITGAGVAEFLTLRTDNPNSMLNSVRAARENARTVRDQISDELWECVNSLRLFLESPDARAMQQQQPAAFYERVLLSSYQFQGIAGSTTPRGETWHFLRLGMMLERSDKVSRLLDTCSGISTEMAPHPSSRPLRWAALLRSCSAWHALHTISPRLEPERIIEFLLLNDAFPRSVSYCVAEVQKTLEALCRSLPAAVEMKTPARLAGRLAADLRYSTLDEILAAGLHDFIDDFQTRLNNVGTAVFETFVLYAELDPVISGGAGSAVAYQPGAWHHIADADAQIQQQQQ